MHIKMTWFIFLQTAAFQYHNTCKIFMSDPHLHINWLHHRKKKFNQYSKWEKKKKIILLILKKGQGHPNWYQHITLKTNSILSYKVSKILLEQYLKSYHYTFTRSGYAPTCNNHTKFAHREEPDKQNATVSSLRHHINFQIWWRSYKLLWKSTLPQS